MKPKISKNPDYEAGFIRSSEDDLSPEDIARVQMRKARWRRSMLIGVPVLLGAAAIVAAVQWRQDSPAKQLARARLLVAAQSHRTAVIELKRSLQGDPQQPAARFLLGQELLLLSDPVGAEIELQKALDGKFDPEQATPALVEALSREGKFDQVVKTVNGATLESPEGNADLQAALGTAYFALGREANAKAAWRAAKEFVPDHAGSLIAEARYLATARQYDAARSILDRIPKTAPKQNELLALQGDIARATNRPADAVTAYTASLTIQPGDADVRSNLAQSDIDVGDYAAAHREIARVLAATQKNPRAEFIDALAYFAEKDFPKAQAAINRSVQLWPNDGRAQLLAGMIALQRDQLLAADQNLGEAMRLMPQSVEARRLLANLYVQRHEAKKADEILKPLWDQLGSNVAIANTEARIAVLENDRARAAAAFDRVRVSDPDGATASIAAASLKIAAGDRTGAITRLRAAAAADPGNGDIDVALVLAYLETHQVAEAQAAWKRADANDPGNARNYNLLSSIDLARNDPVAARASMEKARTMNPDLFMVVGNLAALDVREKKVDDARALLKQFIATHPDNTDAIMTLVQLEDTAGGSPDTIVALLRDARRSAPTSTRVVNVQVAFYLKQGDPAKARAMAIEGLAFAPSDFGLLQSAGDLAYAAKDYPAAVEYYGRLASINSESTERLVPLGMAELQLHDGEAALNAFKTIVTRLPERYDLQVSLVGTLLTAGLTDQANRLVYEIKRVSPKSTVVPELEADIKLAQKELPEAIAAYRRALDATPTPQLAIKLYDAYGTARQRGEAVTFLMGWIDAHPKEPTIRIFDADRALSKKDYRRAADDLRVVLDGQPGNALVMNNLAWTLAQLQDPDALRYAEKANALAPDNAAIADTFGWMLVERGQQKRGLGLIERAAAHAPDLLDVRLHLAKAQIKDGQRDAALTTLRSLVTQAPDSEQAKESKTLIATL